MRILVDIGGTYARFAAVENNRPARIKKYAAADFESFDHALARYIAEHDLETTGSLLIATAAHPGPRNVWRFVNKNRWEIDVPSWTKKGWPVEIILNDFEAATWGLLGAEKQIFLKTVERTQIAPCCLIGPGTGLGLGYLIPLEKGVHVQGTKGGHIPTAAVTDEQARVLRAVEKIKGRTCLNVYEDVVSGPGLFDLYRACCDLSEEEQIAQDVEAMLGNTKSRAVQDALRLFHEFFGLFAATVTVAGNAYGGLYLTGGVLDRLREKNLFDFGHFEKFFAGNFVPSVKKSLNETPVIHVTDPYLPLHGLLRAQKVSDA